MKSIICSFHAERRMNQRGIRNSDVDLIRGIGTHLEDDGESFLLTDKDVSREIAMRKREIQNQLLGKRRTYSQIFKRGSV